MSKELFKIKLYTSCPYCKIFSCVFLQNKDILLYYVILVRFSTSGNLTLIQPISLIGCLYYICQLTQYCPLEYFLIWNSFFTFKGVFCEICITDDTGPFCFLIECSSFEVYLKFSLNRFRIMHLSEY